MRMNIAFITPEYITEQNFDGGLSTYLYRTALALKELGHRPLIIVGSDKNDVITHQGITVHRVDVKRRHLDRFFSSMNWQYAASMKWIYQSFKLNRALNKILQVTSIDIAHFTSYTATALFRPRHIPAVVRISAFQPLINEAYGAKKNNFLYFLEVLALKRADRLTCPSMFIASKIEKLTRRQVMVIESPYVNEPDTLDSKACAQTLHGKKYLLFFGSVGRLKGVDIVAEALPELLSRHKNLYFVFAGKDVGYRGKKMMDYVWQQSGEHKDRVLYLGVLQHTQLYPVIQNSHAVILPSRIDNLPNACIEAMAHGKIVLGTSGTSFEQLIDNGISGFLCAPDDPSSLTEAVDKILCLDASDMSRIGNKAQQRIEKLHPSIVVNELLRLYESAISKGTCATAG